jgi:hypothetical protein
MENLRNLDKSKRAKPLEVKNLLKMPTVESNPITEEDSEFLSNFGLLVPDNYHDLSDDCAKQVQFLRQWDIYTKKVAKSLEKRRLHKILKKNSKLLFKFMILLRHKSKLHQDSSSAPPYFSKRMSSIFCKLVRRKCVSLKAITKICIALAKSNIVCKSWLEKPFEEMEAKLWKARPLRVFG